MGMAGIRITGGTHKGRRIAISRDGRTRYTSAKVRQAVFNLVGDVAGLDVLDLFAGAGSFTLEALSRGAASVTAVEKARATASLLRLNLRDLALDKDCLVLNMEVRYAVPMLARQGKTFDLIFADPPYEMGHVAASLELIEAYRLCRAGTVLVFEHSKREGLGSSPGERLTVQSHKYGDTALTILTCGQRIP
jgi:16S rRNA (guanine(966)-N(2))-methyltransferase RsmD